LDSGSDLEYLGKLDDGDDEEEPWFDEGPFSEKLETILSTIRLMFGEEEIDVAEVTAVIKEAIASTSGDYGVEEAKRAGGDYSFPADIAMRDAARFEEAGGDLTALVEKLHDEMLPNRLNLERIAEIVDPSWHPPEDIARLKELVSGMIVRVDEDEESPECFRARSTPPPLRKLYLEVQGAINGAMAKLHERDLVLLIPTAAVLSVVGVHFSLMHWAKKKNKPLGRVVFDAKDAGHGGSSLNSERAKAWLKEHYGEINHPTIETLCQMILRFVDSMKEELGEEGAWAALRLFKADLASAFNLLFFRPDGVAKMVTELTDGLTAIYHVGQFGWAGTPYAFAVISRVLKAEIQRRLGSEGLDDVYCDDIMGITLARSLEKCQRVVVEVITGLLGPDAHAIEKDESGRAVELIGYLVDLDARSVTLSRRNFNKVLYGFFAVDLSKPIRVDMLERLCSWSARYTIILRCLKPFTSILYRESGGGRHRNRNASIHLSELGKMCILAWRATLVLLRLRETTYARPIESFRRDDPLFVVEYDGCLTGVGIILRDTSLVSDEDRSAGILGITSLDFEFDLMQDSSYQNTCEFIGVIVGVAMLVQMGVRGVCIKLKGDSTSSLKWGHSECFTGLLSRKAAFLFTLLAARAGIYVTEKEHIEGVRNDWCDKLSRGKKPWEIDGMPTDCFWEIATGSAIWDLVGLCDPRQAMESADQFLVFWQEARRVIGTV